MRGTNRMRAALLALVALAAVASAGTLLPIGRHAEAGGLADSRTRVLQSTDGPRLVSVQAFPDVAGSMCEPAAASANRTLLAALQQQEQIAAARTAADENARRADVAKRKPLRMIRDPYAAFSSVAVDLTNNEVVMTDENLFQILVYNRAANTPATAEMTEPKRVLAGNATEIEFQCGLYIDPKTGDIYGTNNDTVDKLVIFSRQAKGDAAPTRELHTPHGSFGIAVDETAQEMYLTIQHDNAIVVYPKLAQKEDRPIRLIQGDRTLMADPHGIALDTRDRLIFVTNYGSTHSTRETGRGPRIPNWPLSSVVPGSGKYYAPSITVYRMDASGDVAPLRMIQGPKTRMNWATGITVDPDRNEVLVANDMGDEVLVFDLAAQGDVAPKSVLKGPKTMIKNPTGLYLDSKNNELWVTNFGNHTATVYRRGAIGDTPPLRMIRSGPAEAPAPMMGNPHPVAYDSKRDEILVPN